MTYIAAIDIGSNALRLAIARNTSQHFHICHRDRKAVRLGSDVFNGGKIENETYEALRNAILIFKNKMENFNVQNYRAVATSAMREARNNRDVIRLLKEETGINLELIDGEEEAKLVFEAIATKVNFNSKSHLLIDIGGGSIELVAVFLGKILKKKSFPLGTVRLLSLQQEHGEDQMREWLVPHIQKVLNGFFLDLAPFDFCVGTGGNMDRFAKMKELMTGKVSELVEFSEIQKMGTELEKLNIQQRIEKFELAIDRADVILPAIIATETIMKMADAFSIKLPQVGLKEGILYELSSSGPAS